MSSKPPSKYPRRADNYGPDNSGRYPLRWEVQRIIQHAKKILRELDERKTGRKP